MSEQTDEEAGRGQRARCSSRGRRERTALPTPTEPAAHRRHRGLCLLFLPWSPRRSPRPDEYTRTQHAHVKAYTRDTHARPLTACLHRSHTRARARARARRHLDSPYPLHTRQLEPRGSARYTRPYVKDEAVLFDCRRGLREKERGRERERKIE